jgi:hypothetical protein
VLLAVPPHALLTPFRQAQYKKLPNRQRSVSAFEMKFLSAAGLVAASFINAVYGDGMKSIPTEHWLD